MLMTVLPITSVTAETDWATLVPAKAETGATFRLGVVSDSHIGVGATKETRLRAKLPSEAQEKAMFHVKHGFFEFYLHT